MSKWMMVEFESIFSDCTKEGTKIPKEKYEEYGEYPIIDQGQEFITGFTNDRKGIFTNTPAIIFGDHTRIIKYIDFPFFLGADGIKVLKSKINHADCKYLYYALKNLRIPNTGYNRHYKWLKESQIPLPPIDEQKRIAEELDKISGLIAKRKCQLEKLDLLIKAKFVEMFGDPVTNPMGWEEEKLGYISHVISGITKGRKTKEEELIEVPYMAVSNVKAGYIDTNNIKTILATKSEIQQYKLIEDDILMTEGGDPDKLGRGAIIKYPPHNCIHQNHIYRVRLDRKFVLPEYFSEYLQEPKSKLYCLWCAKQTTGIASINMTQLKGLPVLIPPINIQNQFADYVTKVEQTKTKLQQGLVQLETLCKARMQEYFE